MRIKNLTTEEYETSVKKHKEESEEIKIRLNEIISKIAKNRRRINFIFPDDAELPEGLARTKTSSNK